MPRKLEQRGKVVMRGFSAVEPTGSI
jgi:hypothetical protein